MTSLATKLRVRPTQRYQVWSHLKLPNHGRKIYPLQLRCLATTTTTSSKEPNVELAVQSAPNKGLGVFAKESIEPYTLIIADNPLLLLSPSEDLPQAYSQYQSLSLEMRQQYLQHHTIPNHTRDNALSAKLFDRGYPSSQIPEMVKVSSVFTSNAFNIPSLAQEEQHEPYAQSFNRAFFPYISRLNHSCAPNAHTYADPATSQMRVRSLTNIPAGREIEISYFNLLLPRAQRQTRARDKWGFECACLACAGPETETLEARRERVRTCEIVIAQTAMMAEKETKLPEKVVGVAVESAIEMVQLVKEDWTLRAQLPHAYDFMATAHMIAFEYLKEKEPLATIEESLEQAVVAELQITGESSQVTINRFQKLNAFRATKDKLSQS